ncbi:MAG TPA: TonB-dependent receptor [Candidatus Eisenbacteria bacterium]|nr:TonB-dependent receptor [Candidatus Eisenbacteria bacterium]
MVSVQGNVIVLRAGQAQPQPARLNDTYCPGDRIQVADRSRADVQLTNQPVLRLDQNTLVTLAGLKDGRASIIDLARGALHFFSRLPRNLEINTAFVNAGVEGTEGLVQVETDRTFITIFDGRVVASNPLGSLALASGESALAVQGQALVLRVVVRPRDAVQWALYYPPVIYFRPDDFQGPEPWQAMVRNSLNAAMKGDYQAAFEAIKGVPPDVNDPRFFAYRASLLLGVGRVDEAAPDLERALKLNPNYGAALALQSIVAVVQNDKDRALELAQKATADPKSASAFIALSYAQQANFDLEGARTSVQQAVELDPNNALAWARLAELHLSFAELDRALEAAQKAVSLDPNLSRTQMVLGFAHLLRVEIDQAQRAFIRAIELDQADSLSRLGLGLARIRESNFEEGRKEIEIAASLDPNNSIIRSYLGKAYYEEKRTGLDEREYSIAKELDPKDPTPWFYSAIQKQTTNRPVEALQEMERAIELNDNRAVYRSQLLLDSDLAARSASLARIYSDLGFQSLALVEGWKSVNTDPTNFSAHRFLADSYAILPRHEIARVSELLQSQLLQPLNMTPIQPHLAESNLFLISAQGPTGLSFNEFNPLFNRDGLTFQTSGLAGEDGTYGGEGVLAGIYKKASFSLGGFHFRTDGFRTNSDQRDNIANAFLQFQLSPRTSIQGEYRYRNVETGDLRLRFFPQDFAADQRDKEERHTYRFGVRHDFSPRSVLLGSIMHSEVDFENNFAFFDQHRPESATSSEFQHLFRAPAFNLVSGLGYFKTDGKIDQTLILPPPIGPTRLPRIGTDLKHTNVYLYLHLNAVRNVTFTLGASGDFTDGESPDVSGNRQFNPKFGITWNPLPNTTLRAAAFRTLKRTLITDQTLEPTQVAGFNQFFDDANGTRAWRYGAAIDRKFTRTLFGGVEFSKRDVKATSVVADATGEFVVQREDADEYLGRAYLFWTPHRWLALRTEYMFERFESEGLTDLPIKADTHRVPLGISFFHPSGWSFLLKGTYWNQDGRFFRTGTGIFQSGRENFWVVDAGLNYRLPKRYGFITVGVTNLFDNKFRFFDLDFKNPAIRPDRMFFTRITLALP